jgi:hypothetical protein
MSAVSCNIFKSKLGELSSLYYNKTHKYHHHAPPLFLFFFFLFFFLFLPPSFTTVASSSTPSSVFWLSSSLRAEAFGCWVKSMVEPDLAVVV